ncbi:MAG: hypothetical protein ABSA53_16310 [Streptosporangiaceae bacterium]
MHPEIAKVLVAQRYDELTHNPASRRGDPARRRFPRWHVSWTRTVLTPAELPAAVGAARSGRAGRAGRRGSSVVIVISAHRSA